MEMGRRTSRAATSGTSTGLTNSMSTRDPAVPIRVDVEPTGYLSPSDPVSVSTTVGSRMDYPWTLTPHQVLGHFHVDPTTGLSLSQVTKHTETYGVNGAYSPLCYTNEN